MRSAKGSVYRIGRDVWRVQVEAPRDPVTGARRRPSQVVRGSRRRAEEVRVAMLASVGDTSEARRTMTLGGFWSDMYLPDASERLRERTVRGYMDAWSAHVSDLGSYKLSAITPAVVSSWLSGMPPATARESFKVLRLLMGRALRWDLVDSNPCLRVDPPKAPRRDFATLDWQDAQVYMWHFEHTPLGALVLLVIGGGFTRSEAVGLDWRDVSDGVVTVDNAVTSVNGRAVDDLPKNPFRIRKVKLPASVSARLERLRGPDDAPVVANSDGGRMNPDNVTKLYRRLQRTLPEGCPRVPLKDLRHTSLSLAVDAGADVYAVSRRAGHSSVTTTERFYLKPHRQLDEGVSEAMDSLL